MDDNRHDGLVPARVARRRFLQTIPAAIAGGLAVPVLAQQQAPAPPRLDAATLDCAEKVFGIDFSEAEDEQMARGVSRNLDSFEQLRQMNIPLDTEPAVTFRPYLPGKKPKPGATPGAKIKVTAAAAPAARRASLDDLAFLPITALAPMIQRRDVSATDLTKMYLARLKKFGPKLNCVVTLTEDLALAQAEAADREIRAGRYKGPLHGIPWGAKDLFATKGIPTTWGAGPYQNQVFDYDATIVERLRDAGADPAGEAVDGRARAGRQLVPRTDQESLEPRRSQPAAVRIQRVVSRAGLRDRRRAGGLRHRHGNARIDHLAVGRQRRHGTASNLRTREPLRRDGAFVDDGQGRADVPVGGGLRAGLQRDLRPRRTRRHRCRCAVHVEPGRPVVEAADRLHQGGIRAPARRGRARRRTGRRRAAGSRPRSSSGQREERLKIYTDALDVYRKAGATLEPIELPASITRVSNTIGFILSVEAAAAFDDLTRSADIDDKSLGSWPNTFRTHRFVPAVEYIRAQRARTLLIREMDTLMSQYDAFVSTTNSSTLGVTNLTGHPAVALKAGFQNHAPVELMVTGGLYDEATTLRVALAFERATDWHNMNPEVA